MEMGPGSQKAKTSIGLDLRSFLRMRLSCQTPHCEHTFFRVVFLYSCRDAFNGTLGGRSGFDCEPRHLCIGKDFGTNGRENRNFGAWALQTDFGQNIVFLGPWNCHTALMRYRLQCIARWPLFSALGDAPHRCGPARALIRAVAPARTGSAPQIFVSGGVMGAAGVYWGRRVHHERPATCGLHTSV
jgi:hypothetical protein